MVYFCADDYGISKSYNKRIEECLEKGVLNKVSVLPNGDIDDFMQKLSGKNALLTLHLNLVEGYPLSAPEDVNLLIDKNGCFKYSFIGLFLKTFSFKRKEIEKQLYKEIQKQLQFWVEKTGSRTISIDCHQHAYVIPFVFKTLVRVLLDEQLEVKYLRIPAEPLRAYLFSPSLYKSYHPIGLVKQWLLKGLAFLNRRSLKGLTFNSAYFMGVMLSGKLDQASVQQLMKYYSYYSKKKKRNIEIAFHPGCAEENSDLISGSRKDFRKFYSSPWRNSEYEALMNIELSDAIKMMKEGH